jgi:hypothetical protein
VSQVDEIRSMGKAARGGIDVVGLTALKEGSRKHGVERRILPLALILQEQGECVCTVAS